MLVRAPEGTGQALPAPQGNFLRMSSSTAWSLAGLFQDQEIIWPSHAGVVTRQPPRILGKGR